MDQITKDMQSTEQHEWKVTKSAEAIMNMPISLNEKRRICGLPPIDDESADTVFVEH